MLSGGSDRLRSQILCRAGRKPSASVPLPADPRTRRRSSRPLFRAQAERQRHLAIVRPLARPHNPRPHPSPAEVDERHGAARRPIAEGPASSPASDERALYSTGVVRVESARTARPGSGLDLRRKDAHMWSDRETTEDCLGFEAYVESLATVCLEPEIAPLTLGIFGSWGSGKTSLMKMLETRVAREAGVKTVWANAWRYEGKDEMQSALIHAILAVLKEEKSPIDNTLEALERLKKSASVLKLGKFISKTLLTMSPDITGLLDCFQDESEKLAETMAQFERDFETLLAAVGVQRIVVFVDDLDRCQSAKVVDTFETIKLFLNIPGCTFVIGADALKIEHAIREHYRLDYRAIDLDDPGGRTFAEDYLEKIVQIPFRIPEQTLPDIAWYVGMLILRQELASTSWRELVGNRQRVIDSVNGVHEAFVTWLRECREAGFRHDRSKALVALQRTQPYVSILAHGLRGNPRQIKRFLNILELRQRLARANSLDVVEDLLIKVLVLEYTWRPFFEDVVDNYDAETGRSELLAEVVRLYQRGETKDPKSPVVTKALETPGLVEFLQEGPALHEAVLTPYLYLAQTAIQGHPVTLTPPDEEARLLSERIADADRIRSKSAAREAARAAEVVAAAVVRTLGSRLLAEAKPVVQVNIANALAQVCERHPPCVGTAVSFVEDVDLTKNEALALAILPLIERGEAAGMALGPLRKKVEERSGIAKALTGRARPRPRRARKQ